MDIRAAVQVTIEDDTDDLVDVDRLYALRDSLYALVAAAFPDDRVETLVPFACEGWL